jgi:serine phosphatase RsbU (regulator of sigma subunit)
METLFIEDTKIIEEQNRLLEEKNKSLTDSLNYAKLIQNAITHKDDNLKQALPNSFMLEIPLDIVSGDFVRVDKKDEKILLALADCTGHGIPGALMSMIGCTLLNGIVNCKNKIHPSVILKVLNAKFKKLTRQATIINDGMDIGFCSIDLKKMELVFAGAHRPLYLIRNNELIEMKGDNLSIGYHTPEDVEFKSHNVKLQKGDSLYMFSDGYIDQFGGEKGKKFSTKRFKETLLSIQHLDMDKQELYLREVLSSWKKGLAQVDDICVLGFCV